MEDKFISERYKNIGESYMDTLVEKALKYDDLINFGIGDPDLNTCPEIINAGMEDELKGYTHYGSAYGDIELRQSIVDMYKEDYDIDIDTSEVFVTASATCAMHLTLEALLDDGDEVILIGPYFAQYKPEIEMVRGVAVECPTYYEDEFQVKKENLEACITNKTKAIIVNTPTNPTGNCLSLDTLKMIRDIAVKYDLIVIADDIYTIYSFKEPFMPILKLEGMKERTITINSFSKDFLMTGWRLGNIVTSPNFIKSLLIASDNVTYTAPMISQRAGIYALKHRDEIRPTIATEYKKRLNYAADRINKMNNIQVLSPAGGTFYLFVDIRQTKMSSMEFSQYLLKEGHILVFPGTMFGECGEGFVRLAVTIPVEKMAVAFDRMEKLDLFK